MRYKVETQYGYISFNENEKERAYAYYHEEGIRLYLQEDVLDEGTLIEGTPIVIDYTLPGYNPESN